jgi:L-amino acid N-acyltransferase YncA/mannose-6-phosphate isomerase-like protein (cupin superfamily)
MATLIEKPTTIRAAGQPPKVIEELIGRVNCNTGAVSIARMKSPLGWSEPGQTPEFDEYTVVLRGSLRVTLENEEFDVRAGQAIIVEAGEWVQYSTPSPDGAEYIAVCLPAFSPAMVHRDDDETSLPQVQKPAGLTFETMSERHGREVIDIFNHYITQSFAAYPDQPMPYEFFGRYQQMTQGYPAFVAVADSGRVIGFGLLRPIHPAGTLRRTAEVSYFISPEYTRQGIGRALLDQLIEKAIPLGIDSLVASISSKNESSMAFHRKNGFRECGRFQQAGRKNDQDFDIVWMQRRIRPSTEKEA